MDETNTYADFFRPLGYFAPGGGFCPFDCDDADARLYEQHLQEQRNGDHRHQLTLPLPPEAE